MNTATRSSFYAHLCMLGACLFWGLMAPIGKAAMLHGMTGLSLVSCRIAGGALLFWIASLLVKRETVAGRDKLLLAGAALLGLVCNQCGFTIGLSLTSPNNASIMTTAMPIFAMLLSFFILREPLTVKKVGGVVVGCCGALILILTSATTANTKVGNVVGDLLCLGSQFSYALYLSLFRPLVQRYSVFTINKWLFLWASLLLLPFTYKEVAALRVSELPMMVWWETAYVVFFGTFVCYLLVMYAQRILRPTVVSSYNYAQPLIAISVSVGLGMSIFQPAQGLAVVLVFLGVWWVTHSRAKKENEDKIITTEEA